MAATTIIDAIGTPITLGSTVRLTGTVTGISPFDTHYGEVTVTPQYAAVPKANMGIVNDIANGIAQPTINANPVNVSPAMLLAGAGGTGGISQTPWTSDIDGGGFKLFNVASIATGPVAVTGDVNVTGAFRINGVAIQGQTPWTQNILGGGFSLSNVATISAGTGNFTNVNVTGAYTVNGQPIPKQTPWTSSIDAAGFALSNVSNVASTGNITAVNVNITGSYQVNGVNIAGQTPWQQNIDASGHTLSNLAGMLGISVASPAYALDVSGDINCTGTFRVGGVPFTSGVPPTRQVIGGAGMGGGGALSADVTLTANVISVFGRIGPVVLQAADISAAGGVLTTRNINTGSGMSGGGALNADINLTSFNNVYVNGTLIGARVGINIVAGSNVTVAASDDSTNNKVNVTITSTGTTGSGSPQTPWASNIDAGGFTLNNAGNIVSTVFTAAATGAALAFLTPSSTATITGAGDAKFNSITIPSGTAKATITSAGNASFASVTSNGVAVLTSLPISTATVLGGVKVGANVSVAADGTISVAAPNVYTLPAATATLLGGVKVGANISVAGDGTISVAAPGGSQTPWTSDIDAAGHNLNNAGGVGVSASSTNSVSVQIANTVSGGHSFAIYSSGGGPSPAGSFGIYDNTSGGTKFLIAPSGNVGIGTTAPAAILHTINANGPGFRTGDGTNDYTIGRDNASGWLVFNGLQASYSGYKFQINNGVNVLSIASSTGYVGIGNAAPAYPLDVAGDIHCTGSVRTTTIAATGSVTCGAISSASGRSYFSANSETLGVSLQYNSSTAGPWIGSNASGGFTISSSSGTARLAIDAAGHVTINAADDGSSALRVSGVLEVTAGNGYSQNLYNNGSNWIYRANGAGFTTNIGAGVGVSFYAAPTGTAGATAAQTLMLTFAAPNVTIANVPMIIAAPGSLPAPVQGSMFNGSLTFVHNSSTSILISVRCSDGAQRSVQLSLT